MASENTNRRRHALASVYHFGRRDMATALGRGTPKHVAPLESAVDDLLRSEINERGEDESTRSVRLALADLCRTQAKQPNRRIATQIERLAVKLAGPGGRASSQSVRAFANMFARGRIEPDQAYLQAMKLMLQLHPTPETRARVEIYSYTVTRK